MTTLNIGGTRIKVDDAFLSLSPDQQQATVEEIAASLPKAEKPKAQDTAVLPDVVKSIPTGIAKGVAGLAGLPRAAQDLVGAGLDKLLGPRSAEAKALQDEATLLPSADTVTGAIEGVTGPLHKPQTQAGRYAETAAEFAPAALAGPGGILRKLGTQALIPGAASEYAGELTKGTQYEPYARIAGALTGVGIGAGVNAGVTGVQNRIATGRIAGEIGEILRPRYAQPIPEWQQRAADEARKLGADVRIKPTYTYGPAPKIGAGATRRLAQTVEADAVTPQAAGGRAAELGDDAMLLDVGRQLRGRAEAVAAQPGRGQNVVLDAVEGRTGRFGEETARRVQQTLDNEMGQTHNVVELQNRVDDAVNRIARPLYDDVMQRHPVVWDATLERLLQRPAIAQALDDAAGLARNYGEVIDVTAQPSLRAWDYAKKALDARINGMMRTGGIQDLNSAQKADLGGLQNARTALVNHLDQVTNNAYRDARRAMATKYELREALETGRAAFNTRLLPEEFAEVLQNMSLPERAMAQAGFRRELDRIIEATRNEGATARRVLDTNNVLQKTEMLFGPQAVQAIERRIGAENTFQEATQDIARNSRTAVRQQLIKDTSTPSTSEIRQSSLTGLGLAGARGGLNYIRNQGMERTRGQIADVLTAPRDQIEPIVAALTGLNVRRAVPRGGSPGQAALIASILAGQH